MVIFSHCDCVGQSLVYCLCYVSHTGRSFNKNLPTHPVHEPDSSEQWTILVPLRWTGVRCDFVLNSRHFKGKTSKQRADCLKKRNHWRGIECAVCKQRRVPTPTTVHRAVSIRSFCHYANKVSHDIYASYFKLSHLHLQHILFEYLIWWLFLFSLFSSSFHSHPAVIKSNLPQEKNICANKTFGTCVTITVNHADKFIPE